jgi:hypothetical protein
VKEILVTFSGIVALELIAAFALLYSVTHSCFRRREKQQRLEMVLHMRRYRNWVRRSKKSDRPIAWL